MQSTFTRVYLAAAILSNAAAVPVKADWSGFYIGAHGGWQSGSTRGSVHSELTVFPSSRGDPQTSPFENSMRGWVAGGQAGYNHQFGHIVAGLEVAGSWSTVNGTREGTIVSTPFSDTVSAISCYRRLDFPNNSATHYKCNANQNWTFLMLFRAGYVVGDGRLLPYIIAGPALTGLRLTGEMAHSQTGTTIRASWGPETRVLFGGVIGSGIKYALNDRVAIGMEYLFARYPNQDFTTIARTTDIAGGISSKTIQQGSDLMTHSVRVTANYRFRN